MDKEDIKALIRLLQMAIDTLDSNPQSLKPMTTQEIQHWNAQGFDLIAGDYAITNLKKREFLQRMKALDSPGSLN